MTLGQMGLGIGLIILVIAVVRAVIQGTINADGETQPKPEAEIESRRPGALRPAPQGDRIAFRYVDRAGNLTNRTVTPTQLDFHFASDGTRVVDGFDGHCHDRGAIRTFRLEDMSEAHNAETGEVFADHGEIAAWLSAELPTPSGRRRRKPKHTAASQP
ncbi:WYL domain-containing protein [Roseomonas sp. USHLN139]|uniref:WYL domain-containing protein n=1 Tax=Roseomonas sp. USHLN139 TaxID=3081298 RepID=UPI003B02333A